MYLFLYYFPFTLVPLFIFLHIFICVFLFTFLYAYLRLYANEETFSVSTFHLLVDHMFNRSNELMQTLLY